MGFLVLAVFEKRVDAASLAQKKTSPQAAPTVVNQQDGQDEGECNDAHHIVWLDGIVVRHAPVPRKRDRLQNNKTKTKVPLSRLERRPPTLTLCEDEESRLPHSIPSGDHGFLLASRACKCLSQGLFVVGGQAPGGTELMRRGSGKLLEGLPLLRLTI
jgi:hypothetical protein